ncbi:DNA translocase FtsK [Actinomadura rupiterrae]|uniref:DNA translocase FtsK n=1 Tax=Actinomadura rupiterrae TaxID=559627 RepID=UPI0020A46B24|nr:DNA translocase FtsK [Actinomadura rupiterrae]MCP2339143.1 S-DNA-T family DNA segregation ATPase FtsK/SpoIIIE [Actinomadura rupiterrae]
MDTTTRTENRAEWRARLRIWDRLPAGRTGEARARLGRGYQRATAQLPEWLQASDLDEAELTRRAKDRLIDRSRQRRDAHIEAERQRRADYGHGYRPDPPPPVETNPTPTSGEVASERRRARMARWGCLVLGSLLLPQVAVQVPLLLLVLPVAVAAYLWWTGAEQPEPPATAATADLPPGPPAVRAPKTGTALDLLHAGAASRDDGTDAERTSGILDKVLAEHKVDARVTGHVRGPTITRYLLTLGPGVRGSKVAALADDIGRAMECEHPPWVGAARGDDRLAVELPNRVRDMVMVGDVLRGLDLAGAGPLTVALGRDVDGTPVGCDLTAMPHLMVGGATGSGKSVFLNSLICGPLVRGIPPEVLRMILIDPKRVELAAYRPIPHLLRPIITEAADAVEALAWLAREGGEMDRRYEVLAANGCKHIDGYNTKVRNGTVRTLHGQAAQLMPYLLVVLDELADLIIIAREDVETHVVRIMQLARAAGIHLVVATQRPSVDVVTGLIKANMPSRLAFATSSLADSRVILDQGGAEKLIGAGDALYRPMGAGSARRLQAAMITDEEIAAVVARATGTTTEAPPADPPGPDPAPAGPADELLATAARLVVEARAASTSMLRRELRIRHGRAAALMSALQAAGVVGPADGTAPRAVLATRADLPVILARLETR